MTSSIRGRNALVSSVIFLLFFVVLLGSSLRAGAAPYAAMVMDARSGEVLHSRNADTRLHPASLTKMMTLYVAFEAIERGEIGLDTRVTISKNAANEVPSKLGLRAGQKIELRYLIRAAAVKSANDAATAIGEAISGSEARFARRMNRTAKALGMTRSTFKNAHGLTAEGHLSTARDMTILGRHLFYDYPAYYNLFSRRSTDAKIGTVYNTNRKFLAAYKGADGIKTGYTRAAGSNLVASAERGGARMIATVFGGTSSAARNAKVAELLDMGFRRAPARVAVNKPKLPAYAGNEAAPEGAKTIRVSSAMSKSIRPQGRPDIATEIAVAAMADEQELTFQSGIEEAIALATAPAAPPARSDAIGADTVLADAVEAVVSEADAVETADTMEAIAASDETEEVGTSEPAVVIATAEESSPSPKARPPRLDFAAVQPALQPESEPIVVTRASTSGGRHWGINVGAYPSRYKAERVLLKTALNEISTLDGALRKVSQSSKGYDAKFVGMSEEQADLACRRLEARGAECTTFGPSGS
ncbi:MAG: serine hydrolase [Tropicimonas sp.]|uniref:serine hydrolase n=1 Tax=Tropicimonas sp. TaxID=2067044 RepID=UPI003A849B1B